MLLPKEHVQSLARKLAAEQVALVAGMELSHLAIPPVESERRFPSWAELRQSTVEQFFSGDSGAFPNSFDLFDAVVHLRGRVALQESLQRQLDDDGFQLSEAHRALQSLPWYALFSTGYDRFLSRLMAEPSVSDDHVYAGLPGRAPPPRLFSLYGTVDSPHTLTCHDYEQWPEAHPRAWQHFRDVILHKTLLLVGYSASDPQFDQLLGLVRQATEGRAKRLYAWIWHLNDEYRKLLDQRDNIAAIRIDRREDWETAFRELGTALRETTVETTRPEPCCEDKDAYDRVQYQSDTYARYGAADITTLYLPEARFARDDIPLREVFVLPDVEPANLFAELDQEVISSRVWVHSTSSDDTTQAVTVIGRLHDGTQTKDPIHLSGTTPVYGSVVFGRVESIVVSDRSATPVRHPIDPPPGCSQSVYAAADHAGTITVHADTSDSTIAVIEPNGGANGRKPADSWFARNKRLLIIGDAGQGKSTLLRHRLLDIVDRWQRNPTREPLPIYVRLGFWESELSSGAACLSEYLSEMLPRLCEIDPRAVETWKTRPVLWLLDGLDEIRDLGARDKLCEEIRVLASRRPADRWVLTSRPSTCPIAGLGDGWESTRLCPLSDDQIEIVLQRWETVLAGTELLPSGVNEIGQALRDFAALHHLCRNPLLLTLAVLFYRSHRRLPENRWEFYRHADECLRDGWVRHRLSEDTIRRTLPGRYLPELLAALALRNMRRDAVGFSHKDLEEEADSILKHWDYRGRERSQELDRLLAAADDLIGVVVARGSQRYAFLHPTFQEYHAARALTQLPVDDTRGLLRQYWDHPDWSEVWRLYVLAGESNADHLESILAIIVGASHRLDTHICRPERAGLTWMGVGCQPVQDTLPCAKHLLDWADDALSGDDPLVRRLCIDALAAWEKPFPPQIRQHVLALLTDGDWETRNILTHAMAGQTEDYELRRTLIGLFSDVNAVLRTAAANTLANQSGEPTVREALTRLLDDPNVGVVQAAANALATRTADPVNRQILIDCLRAESAIARTAVATALQDKRLDAELIVQLAECIQDPDSMVREASVRALIDTKVDLTIRDGFLALLDDANEYVRIAAARALAFHADVPAVRVALVERVQRDDSGLVREAAVGALAGQVCVEPVWLALLAALNDRFAPARTAAARAVAEHADIRPIRDMLMEMIGSARWQARQAAARALERRSHEPWARQLLLGRLGDEIPDVQLAAIDSLSRHVTNKSVCSALVGRLEEPSFLVRFACTKALRPKVDDPAIRQALLKRFEDDDPVLRQAAVNVLATQIGEPPVRDATLALLQSKYWRVRQAAVQALSSKMGDPVVRRAVAERVRDDNWRVRLAAVDALSGHLGETAVRDTLLAAIHDEDWNVSKAAVMTIERSIASERHSPPRHEAAEPSKDVPRAAERLDEEERADPAQPHVFLSYCRDNLETVRELHAELRGRGLKVWWDQEILPGQDWKMTIRQAMRKAYAVVLCFSKEVQDRTHSGVYPEVLDAIAVYRQIAPGRIFLVPVKLSNCDIPLIEIDDTRTLDRLQYVDLFPDVRCQKGLERLTQALAEAAKRHQ